MSYANNVTMIDQLPDLDDLDSGFIAPEAGLPPGTEHKYKGVIRNNAPRPYPESGMGMGNGHTPVENYEIVQPIQQGVGAQNDLLGISCLDIAGHIDACPICSRFYKHDNTVLVAVIIVLVIVCLLLLKKVLKV